MRKSIVGAFTLVVAACVAMSPVAAKVPPGQAGQDSGPRPPGLIGGGSKKDKSTSGTSCYDSSNPSFEDLSVTIPAGSSVGSSATVSSYDGTCSGIVTTPFLPVAMAANIGDAGLLCPGLTIAPTADSGWNAPANLFFCIAI